MLTTWDQRQRRDKIKVTRIQFPVPTTQDDLHQRLEAAITPQTKVLHICHVTNITGQLFRCSGCAGWPASAASRASSTRRIRVAHFPFKLSELECDFAGTSLHKWLLAPHGHRAALRAQGQDRERPGRCRRSPSGRATTSASSSRSARTWSRRRRRSAKRSRSTRRLGARTRPRDCDYLTQRWANQVKDLPRVKIYTSLEPGQSWGLAYIGIDGIEARKFNEFLWNKVPHHRPGHGAGRVSRAAVRLSRACASRRTSTRRSRNSTRSSARSRTC